MQIDWLGITLLICRVLLIVALPFATLYFGQWLLRTVTGSLSSSTEDMRRLLFSSGYWEAFDVRLSLLVLTTGAMASLRTFDVVQKAAADSPDLKGIAASAMAIALLAGIFAIYYGVRRYRLEFPRIVDILADDLLREPLKPLETHGVYVAGHFTNGGISLHAAVPHGGKLTIPEAVLGSDGRFESSTASIRREKGKYNRETARKLCRMEQNGYFIAYNAILILFFAIYSSFPLEVLNFLSAALKSMSPS